MWLLHNDLLDSCALQTKHSKKKKCKGGGECSDHYLPAGNGIIYCITLKDWEVQIVSGP